MTEHFTQASMKELAGDIGISFYPRCFSDQNLTDLCNAAVNHKLQEWGAQEPVAYLVEDSNGDGKAIRAKDISKESLNRLIAVTVTKLYAAPVAPAQPVNAELVAVAWKHEYFDHAVFQESCPRYPESGWFRLYAALANAKAAPVQGVLEGWKLVPVEPTNNMKSTASQLFAAKPKATPADFYRAMLAAAPQQEQKGGV